MYKCHYCFRTYKHRQSLHTHKKKCVYQRSPKIIQKPENDPEIESPQIQTQIKPKLQTHVRTQSQADNVDMSNLMDKINSITSNIKELMDKPQHTTNNIVNNIINNNVIITEKLPACFYNALISKLGKKEAVNLLNLSSASNSAINIYKELYPSNKMKDNPVIYEDNSFKYLEGNEIVSNNSIITKIAEQIQTAMLYASSNLITESIKIEKTDQLYDIYDIGKIQNNVRNRYLIEKQLSGYIKLELIE